MTGNIRASLLKTLRGFAAMLPIPSINSKIMT